jgi:hypothetical protein
MLNQIFEDYLFNKIGHGLISQPPKDGDVLDRIQPVKDPKSTWLLCF